MKKPYPRCPAQIRGKNPLPDASMQDGKRFLPRMNAGSRVLFLPRMNADGRGSCKSLIRVDLRKSAAEKSLARASMQDGKRFLPRMNADGRGFKSVFSATDERGWTQIQERFFCHGWIRIMQEGLSALICADPWQKSLSCVVPDRIPG
jgi:hypothetical protein